MGGRPRDQCFWLLGKKKKSDSENTGMKSIEISNLVGKQSRFTDSCRDSTDGATIFHLV